MSRRARSNHSPPLKGLLKSVDADRKILPDIWKKNEKRNADEPLRLKLSFMSARIDATRRLVASLVGADQQNVRGEPDLHGREAPARSFRPKPCGESAGKWPRL